jgi:CheY-like chemotaxis protein
MAKKILIIDDSPFFLNMLRDLLSGEFFVETANSGEEAIALLNEAYCETLGHSEPFDLVITDLMMPGLSGYDVSEYVRGRNWKNKFTPVLILTGSDITKQEARKRGCSAYIPKSNLKKVVSMAHILLRS